MRQYLNPLRPIKSSLKRSKKSFAIHKENIKIIKSLWGQVFGSKPETFAQQVKIQSPRKVRTYCLLRKRACILVGISFFLYGFSAVIQGNPVGLVTILTSVPLFYMLSLITSYRLWQIEHQNYDAPISAYIAHKNLWWIDVINPHLSLFGSHHEK